MHKYFYCLLLACCLSSPLQADPDVSFVGRFGDRAVLEIDGKQRVLTVGETSREGVELLSVSADSAVIQYLGTGEKRLQAGGCRRSHDMGGQPRSLRHAGHH